jgi:enoyl-CoA hydratase/carnithine racemase
MKYFLLDQADDIAILTMNQPKVFNRFSVEMLNESDKKTTKKFSNSVRY